MIQKIHVQQSYVVYSRLPSGVKLTGTGDRAGAWARALTYPHPESSFRRAHYGPSLPPEHNPMELTAAEAWSRILERVRTRLPEQIYRSWLAQTEPIALTRDQLSVATYNPFAPEWITDKYGD